MKAEFFPSKACGTVKAPASKSMAHRLLICAGLSGESSVINGIDLSEDVSATIDCLKTLGAECVVDRGRAFVKGINILKVSPDGVFHCRESGSTIRFFVPIALATGEKCAFDGSERLLSRPMDVYSEICSQKGMAFSKNEVSLTVKGPMTSGVYKIPGNISSQFISGLMFVLPLLDGDSEIHVLPPVESRSYIDLTVRALSLFGVEVKHEKNGIFKIKGNQKYSGRKISVEGDYSNAAFLSAFNLFGGNVQVEGLSCDSDQGDAVYPDLFRRLNKSDTVIHIGDCPDLAPVLFSIAAAKSGGVFTGTKRLKIKESDRAQAMADELAKFGTKVVIDEDSVKIYPKSFHKPESILFGHNDHRIVMAMSVLCSLTGGVIDGVQAVSKSYPGFFDDLKN
ncbi:MAG: 3-phosphoshikimate 1-carboxyvinyltransferase, partial [Clostridiales bacterium]|nr:3-phosphoshikimate 1-carboxyvinyltransferase [Clostridiales bacterium]